LFSRSAHRSRLEVFSGERVFGHVAARVDSAILGDVHGAGHGQAAFRDSDAGVVAVFGSPPYLPLILAIQERNNIDAAVSMSPIELGEFRDREDVESPLPLQRANADVEHVADVRVEQTSGSSVMSFGAGI
jgi:hypothetical protein